MRELEIKLESADSQHVNQLLIDGLKEMYEHNIGPVGTPPIHAEYEAICAYGKYSGTLVGVITYRKYGSSIWVNLGYVRPDARRQGVYTAMWDELIRVAKEAEIHRIEGATHVNNFAMRALYKKLGRIESFVIGNYQV